MLVRLAADGAGVALVPRFSASAALETGSLAQLHTTLELPRMAIQVLYRDQKWVTPVMEAFMRLLRSAIAQNA